MNDDDWDMGNVEESRKHVGNLAAASHDLDSEDGGKREAAKRLLLDSGKAFGCQPCKQKKPGLFSEGQGARQGSEALPNLVSQCEFMAYLATSFGLAVGAL